MMKKLALGLIFLMLFLMLSIANEDLNSLLS